MATYLILAAVVLICAYAVYSYIRKLRVGGGCCGEREAAPKRVKVRDRDKRHYPYVLEVTVDGIFGDKTRQAVAAFQNRFGLAPDGVVGEATWEALYRVYQGILNSILTPAERPVPWDGQTLSYGAQGERVLLLQRYLNTVADVYSLPKVNETGYFGNDTRNAVRLFQELADLNPDGVVGEATWRRLSELYADIVTGLTRRAGQFPGSVLRG